MHTNRLKDIFEVDDSSDLPIWVQLRNRMAYLIRTGFFAEGEQLPSVRTIAAEARINYNTVTKAYHELEVDGFIVNVRGRGMFVKRDLPPDENPRVTAADAALEDAIVQYRLAGMTYEEIGAHIQGIVNGQADRAASVTGEKIVYRDAYYEQGQEGRPARRGAA